MSAAIQLVPNTNLVKQQEVAPKQESATYVASKLRITLYPPDGDPEVYENCKVLSGLMPELEFVGILVETTWNFDTLLGIPKPGTIRSLTSRRRVHVTSTTLPYKIEALTDVVH